MVMKKEKFKFIIKTTIGVTCILAPIIWTTMLLYFLFMQGHMLYYEYNRIILVIEFIPIIIGIIFLYNLIKEHFRIFEEKEFREDK